MPGSDALVEPRHRAALSEAELLIEAAAHSAAAAFDADAAAAAPRAASLRISGDDRGSAHGASMRPSHLACSSESSSNIPATAPAF
mmetsp:Transcript_39476/g.71928  ORF Transcript_39476/g.71928 Transcript_39476/m.71928 type:complete len:86 (-) Transcript_39476:935-1192(-)